MMMFIVVFDLKDFDLTEFCGNGNQTMILFDVVDVNVQDIWIEFTLSITEKLAGGIFYKNFEWFVFVFFQIYFVNV
jgi:hypothetical protein